MDNVLLVTVDSLRASHVGYHGYERDTTPALDSLAAEGCRFSRAFAPAGSTQYSFPAILTGVSPLSHGGYDRVSETQTLVSEVFREHGYRTGGFHSNLFLSGTFGYDRGWDAFFDSSPERGLLSTARRYAKVELDGTWLFDLLKRGYDALESRSGINVGSYHVPADELTDRALAFVDRDPQAPTFLWVHYMDVHHPFLPPPEYQRPFREEVVSEEASVKLRRKCIERPEAVTGTERETLVDLYDAAVRATDAEIGRLVDAVADRWDECLLAVTSDHGDHFLERGYFGGAHGYDLKTHVPLFVRELSAAGETGTGTGDTEDAEPWPQSAANGPTWADPGEYDSLVGLTDIPTTLLAAAGLSVPDSYQGHSLLDVVETDATDRDAVFGGWNDDTGTNWVVREPEWKLIEFADGSRELYYLPDDPGERENLVDERPDQARRLAERLADHRELVERTADGDVERPDVNGDVSARLGRLGYEE